MEYISSDQTRKELKAMGRYSMEDKLQVYDQMEILAGRAIDLGKKVILDATFFKKKLRDRFIALATKKAVPYFILWIEASEEITKERLSRERKESEANYPVYLSLSREFEPPELPYLKLLSKQDNIEDMLNQAEEFIDYLS